MTTESPQPYSKAERLLNLLMALRSSRIGLTRDQVRTQVRGYGEGTAAGFERMFERDKEELRSLGVPVTTIKDASGVVTGYRIEGDWALEPLHLEPAGLAMLALAARLWQGADLAPAATNALRKVEARLGMRSSDPPGAPVAGLAMDSPALPDLITACAQRIAVTFAYRKPGGAPAQVRHVQPWGLVSWTGHWYLVGFDTDRGGQRVFRASRIDGHVRPDPEAAPYDVPAGFDARSAVGRFEDDSALTLDLELAPGTGASLRRRAEPLGVSDAGVDLVRLRVHDLSAGVAEALAHAPHARVVAPVGAVAEARRQLEAVIAGQVSAPEARGGLLRAADSSRGAGSAQFERLLALVPWLAANSGVSVEAAAAHFGVTPAQLVADLGSIITSGPDDWHLFDIQYWDDDGVIEVIDALDLHEPLTLSPDEGFALLAALEVLAAVPGGDREILEATQAAVTRALGGVAPDPGAVAVRVDVPDELLGTLAQAEATGRALELIYVGAVRDQVTHRVVDPVAVVLIDGLAYLRGYCRSAQGMRLFRVDRIVDMRLSPLPAEPVTDAAGEVEPMTAALAATGRVVVVDAVPGSRILEGLPTTRRWTLPGGGLRAELPVGDFGWARQLALGGAGEVVVREPEWLAEQVLADARLALLDIG
jgi:predicted DNA-binding transcriptional regulator YafY